MNFNLPVRKGDSIDRYRPVLDYGVEYGQGEFEMKRMKDMKYVSTERDRALKRKWILQDLVLPYFLALIFIVPGAMLFGLLSLEEGNFRAAIEWLLLAAVIIASGAIGTFVYNRYFKE